MITARAMMSGAYEHNWQKHPVLQDHFAKWQNQLPLYNTRLNNLSAALIRPQLTEIPRRVHDGRRNHDYVAEQLNASPYPHVPPALPGEQRAPDSIQFNLGDFSEPEARAFADAVARRGVKVQIFGLSEDNARAFWNWQFLGETPDLPKTRAMLMKACDTRLPARLTRKQLDQITAAILAAVDDIKITGLAYGT